MSYQDDQRRLLGLFHQSFLNRNILHGTVQAGKAVCVYRGATEQGSVIER